MHVTGSSPRKTVLRPWPGNEGVFIYSSLTLFITLGKLHNPVTLVSLHAGGNTVSSKGTITSSVTCSCKTVLFHRIFWFDSPDFKCNPHNSIIWYFIIQKQAGLGHFWHCTLRGVNTCSCASKLLFERRKHREMVHRPGNGTAVSQAKGWGLNAYSCYFNCTTFSWFYTKLPSACCLWGGAILTNNFLCVPNYTVKIVFVRETSILRYGDTNTELLSSWNPRWTWVTPVSVYSYSRFLVSPMGAVLGCALQRPVHLSTVGTCRSCWDCLCE